MPGLRAGPHMLPLKLWLIVLAWHSTGALHMVSYQLKSLSLVHCLLPAGRSDDEVAAEVFDLLGEGVFEHIGTLGAAKVGWEKRSWNEGCTGSACLFAWPHVLAGTL